MYTQALRALFLEAEADQRSLNPPLRELWTFESTHILRSTGTCETKSKSLSLPL